MEFARQNVSIVIGIGIVSTRPILTRFQVIVRYLDHTLSLDSLSLSVAEDASPVKYLPPSKE